MPAHKKAHHRPAHHKKAHGESGLSRAKFVAEARKYHRAHPGGSWQAAQKHVARHGGM